MSLKQAGLSGRLNNQPRFTGRRITLNRVSLRRFPFPAASGTTTAAVYIEDVFSTWLYAGNTNNAQMANNGLALVSGGANGTVLQMPCDSVSDVAPYPNTLTNTDVTINTTTYKYGSGSLFFNGGSTKPRITITPASSDAFVFYGDFTVEAWVYPTSGSDLEAIFTLSSATGWQSNGSGLVVSYARIHYGTTANFAYSGMTSNAWNHIAVVREAGSIRVFVNGVYRAGVAYSDVIGHTSNVPALGVFDFDGSPNYRFPWVGYIDDLRVTNGTAIYQGTATFTPPAAALSTTTKVEGKGGLVWVKNRDSTISHSLADTVRGARNILRSDTTAVSTSGSVTDINSFYPFGFSVGSSTNTGSPNQANFASWTFLRQAKFFDVVTYTGDGVSGRTVSHNLGSTPGMIIVKRVTGTTSNWQVYHRSLGATQYFLLDTQDPAATNINRWNNTEPTATEFTVGNNAVVNGSGATYIAYLFAHNAGGFGATGSDNIITCGSFTSSSSGVTVNLGFEPQWLFVMRPSATDTRFVLDNMRKFVPTPDTTSRYLGTNLSTGETSFGDVIGPNSTGFTVGSYFGTGQTVIYMAIRRGPMRTPTSGTSVFSPIITSAATGTKLTTNFPIDLQMQSGRTNGLVGSTVDRLRGVSAQPAVTNYSVPRLWTYDPGLEGNAAVTENFNNTGFTVTNAWGGISMIYWNFRRAPGFFDVVCYTGTGAAQTQSHNLGVAPELMIVKRRSAAASWAVYSSALGNTKSLELNQTGAVINSVDLWNSTTPTSSVFSIGGSDTSVNASGSTYVNYLFATVAGVSKVGSYTGTGTTQQVDCGFTSGARFVLIKRTDSTGDWYVWDSARGIIAGDDPYLLLNVTSSEVTNTDYIDPYNLGFEISSTAPTAINASGGTYIFLAIA